MRKICDFRVFYLLPNPSHFSFPPTGAAIQTDTAFCYMTGEGQNYKNGAICSGIPFTNKNLIFL
jgi:hypothetical protein